MPAGTRLKLELKHQPESFREAEFPTPGDDPRRRHPPPATLAAERAGRPAGPWKTTGVHPTSLRLRGEGVAEIEGWRCDASQEIAFASERDGRPAAFEGCSLATGNRADEIDFPAGARLFASDGMVYTDGYRDAERWRVMPETGQRVSVRGIALSGGALAFDRDRRLYGLGGTALAEPCNWAPGTTRRAPRSAFRPALPGVRNIRTPGCSVLPAKPLRMPPASAWNTAPRCYRRWTARNSSASTTTRQESSTSSNWRSATTAEPAPRGYLSSAGSAAGRAIRKWTRRMDPPWPSLRYG